MSNQKPRLASNNSNVCIDPRIAYKKTNGQYTMAAIGDNAPLQGTVTVPCGQCMPCRVKKSQEWTVRMMHESYEHKENCFITLTYDDEHLPENNTLIPEHPKKFMKALRQIVQRQGGNKFRNLYAGEYGEESERAHYHACLFGYWPKDAVLYKTTPQGNRLYTSETLNKAWGNKGFVTVGEFNSTTAQYVAKYITKSMLGKHAEAYNRTDPESGEIIKRHPPFQRSSRMPGLGFTFFEKNKNQLYALDFTVIDGNQRSIPKYYDRKFRKEDKAQFDAVKQKRYAKAVTFAKQNPNLSTEQGLLAVQTILNQKINHKKRDFK